jgi:hypothetical protein
MPPFFGSRKLLCDDIARRIRVVSGRRIEAIRLISIKMHRSGVTALRAVKGQLYQVAQFL